MYLSLVALLLVGACQPDTSDAQDVCQQVVADGLAECTAKAWELCDTAYDQVLQDLKDENKKLSDQITALSEQIEQNCSQTGIAYLDTYMHANHCEWVPSITLWNCSRFSSICEAYDPSNPPHW